MDRLNDSLVFRLRIYLALRRLYEICLLVAPQIEKGLLFLRIRRMRLGTADRTCLESDLHRAQPIEPLGLSHQDLDHALAQVPVLSLHHVFLGLLRLDLLSLVCFEVLLRHLFAVVPGLTFVLVLAQNA